VDASRFKESLGLDACGVKDGFFSKLSGLEDCDILLGDGGRKRAEVLVRAASSVVFGGSEDHLVRVTASERTRLMGEQGLTEAKLAALGPGGNAEFDHAVVESQPVTEARHLLGAFFNQLDRQEMRGFLGYFKTASAGEETPSVETLSNLLVNNFDHKVLTSHFATTVNHELGVERTTIGAGGKDDQRLWNFFGYLGLSMIQSGDYSPLENSNLAREFVAESRRRFGSQENQALIGDLNSAPMDEIQRILGTAKSTLDNPPPRRPLRALTDRTKLK